MKILSRDFTLKEKILLVILFLIIVVIAYYLLVDQPVRTALENAANQKASLETELQAVTVRLTQLEKMQSEIDDINANGTLKSMPSYNNMKNVTTLLNDVLGKMGYSIVFSQLTRDGDQIRRNITLQFDAPSYEKVRELLAKLTGSDYRCLIGNVQCTSEDGNIKFDYVRVNATITFYETTVGGVIDSALPAA